MATNDFKPFATGASANVTSQTDWAALPALLSGFQSGKASSAQVNKALRQATFVAAALAQFVSDKSGQNVADDGNLAGFVSKLTTGFANQHLTRSNPFGDIKTDGAAAVSTALANLGLGAGAPAIGIPFFWPSAAMPNTVMDEWSDMVFLKFNGATFSAATYPQLALIIPSLKLPEARGEFLRIWDDGRGVDASRALLSAQGDAIRNITGSFVGYDYNGDSAGSWAGAFSRVSSNSATGGSTTVKTDFEVLTSFDSSRVVPVAAENRPRNIAFNLLVRAK